MSENKGQRSFSSVDVLPRGVSVCRVGVPPAIFVRACGGRLPR
jgi:hypothetical protein